MGLHTSKKNVIHFSCFLRSGVAAQRDVLMITAVVFFFFFLHRTSALSVFFFFAAGVTFNCYIYHCFLPEQFADHHIVQLGICHCLSVYMLKSHTGSLNPQLVTAIRLLFSYCVLWGCDLLTLLISGTDSMMCKDSSWCLPNFLINSS